MNQNPYTAAMNLLADLVDSGRSLTWNHVRGAAVYFGADPDALVAVIQARLAGTDI